MKLFIAGTSSRPHLFQREEQPLYVLESFYYVKEWQIQMLDKWDMFLLDSGAFTFMLNTKINLDLGEYLGKYINFINSNNIKYFFELDIDSVVGYEKVKQMRTELERGTKKKCIPVWHKSRGIEEYKKLCVEYEYIAIGGIVTKEIKPAEYPYLGKLVKLAQQHGTKVHGLGFTNRNAKKYGFYSVDSTNWLSASRFGGVDYFDGEKIVRASAPTGKKCVHYTIRDEFVLKEWIKYQKYLNRSC